MCFSCVFIQLNMENVDWEDLYSWEYSTRESETRDTEQGQRRRSSNIGLTHPTDSGKPRAENWGPLLFDHPWYSGIQWRERLQIKVKMLQLAWLKPWMDDKETPRLEAEKWEWRKPKVRLIKPLCEKEKLPASKLGKFPGTCLALWT